MTVRSQEHLAADPRAADGHPGFRPTRVTEVELCEPLPTADALAGDGAWLVLVRLDSEPIGIIRVEPARVASPRELADRIWTELGEHIAERVPSIDGVAFVASADVGLDVSRSTGYSRRRVAVLTEAPRVAIVLCTRDRPAGLRRTLQALSLQRYPDFEVLVVDNAPTTNETQVVAESFKGVMPTRYVQEPRPGLSWARNRGIEAADGDVLAFIDDDEIPDPHWLAELVRGFRAAKDVGCVTGMILPAEIETKAQEWFEQYGGHSKGRTVLKQLVFDASAKRSQHPLYPLPPFGAGGNMSFTRSALLRIGGFDPALGAGTPARGAEDTAAFSDVMLAGYTLVHRPAAFVWHRHRSDYDALREQLYGYGVGLSSYYVRALWRYPLATLSLVKLMPAAIRDYFDPRSLRREKMTDFPEDALKAHLLGMMRGLIAYPMSVRRQRALTRTASR
ncbi:MAG TPA: glycosyltransferase family 2 protein [Solirubrobacteraceae bacterium]|nr:glycosyltransferase family 2 protein [Solirubrobacteraceae bacterium]